MQVSVVGGSGFIGRHLSNELAARGHDVTAVSRSPDDGPLAAGVETAVGDVTEPGTLEDALDGSEAIVNLVALSPLFKPRRGRSHDAVHREGTENLLAVAERLEIDRFVQQSALDADAEAPTAALRAKGRAEEAVRASELDWTISRPSVVFGEGGEFVEFTKRTKRWFAPMLPIAPLPGGGRTRFQPIWIGDLVPALASIVEDDGHVGETYEFGGPEVLTLAEITRMVFRSEGRPVTVVSIPMPVARLGLTIMEVVPGMPFGLDQYRSLEMDNSTTENAIVNFGKKLDELKTFGTYLGLTEG